MKLSKQEVMKIIPHRDPFLFIDEIHGFDFPTGKSLETITPDCMGDFVGSKIKAGFYVSPEMSILAGHFPGNPILPGVVQVEIMAQASAFFMAPYILQKPGRKMQVALLGVTQAKFRKPVTPGMKLNIETTMSKERGQILSFDAKILVEDKVVSESSFLASFRLEESL